MKKQHQTPIITLTNTDEKHGEKLIIDSVPDPDGVLGLISNDLDFLLNRTHEVPINAPLSSSASSMADGHQHHIHQQLPAITPPPPAAFSNNSQQKSPTLLLHDVIIEESEHEVDS